MCNKPEDDEWKFPSVTINYTWDVRCSSTFFHELRTGDFIESPIFHADKYDDTKWRLLLYPKGLNREADNHASLFIYCESTEYLAPMIPSKISFSIYNLTNNELKTNEADESYSFPIVRKGINNICWGFLQFTRSENIMMNISAQSTATGSFPLICEINTRGPIFPHTDCQLDKDIGQMLESEQLSDVTLKVDEQIFHAHKVILAARSPVFAAMFQREMWEKVENYVTVSGISCKVFKELLRYIYTGKVANFKDTVFELLLAADEYRLDELKIMCEIYLYNSLTNKNAADIVVATADHCSAKFRIKAFDFIDTLFWRDRFAAIRKISPDSLRELAISISKIIRDKLGPQKKVRKRR